MFQRYLGQGEELAPSCHRAPAGCIVSQKNNASCDIDQLLQDALILHREKQYSLPKEAGPMNLAVLTIYHVLDHVLSHKLIRAHGINERLTSNCHHASAARKDNSTCPPGCCRLLCRKMTPGLRRMDEKQRAR